MTQYRPRLTDQDIRRLIKSDTEDERAAAAHKLCRSMGRTELNSSERDAAQKILTVLANDAAELVRRALAVTLKSSDVLPRDLARRLARDVDSVALPIISSSPVFNDDDLIEIVRGGSALRQIAVARRDHVPADVSTVLADEGCQSAVLALVANDNADVAEPALERVVDRFGTNGDVVAAMSERRVLPVSVTQRLVELATDAVREHLVSRLNIKSDAAEALMMSAQERATIDLVDQAVLTHDLPGFVAYLHSRKALRPSLLLRGLARGHMSFFELALVEMTGAPHERVWIMVHDAGPLGLRAIYDRAGLPPRLFDAFRAGVDVWRAIQAEGTAVGSDAFSVKMLQRFLSQRPKVSPEDMSYLLDRMEQIQLEAKAEPSPLENAA
jgi:uncharacterized protein (DUF2336 family)